MSRFHETTCFDNLKEHASLGGTLEQSKKDCEIYYHYLSFGKTNFDLKITDEDDKIYEEYATFFNSQYRDIFNEDEEKLKMFENYIKNGHL